MHRFSPLLRLAFHERFYERTGLASNELVDGKVVLSAKEYDQQHELTITMPHGGDRDACLSLAVIDPVFHYAGLRQHAAPALPQPVLLT